jgi:LuxR family maltose regulon positive regulatory protein
MHSSRPRIPKICRPRLGAVLNRTRLFRLLDSAVRSHPVVWLSAPAGSGKTMLASSWLRERGRPCLWYQVDARDADPAAFFYYLREAVRQLSPRRRETLPLLTPEYGCGIPAYSHNFFEHVGARLPQRTCLVLDNFHDCPEDALIQSLLPDGLSSLSPGAATLILSRNASPPSFAKLLTHGIMALVNGEELALTDTETGDLMKSHTGRQPDADEVSALRKLTEGWIAGTVLLISAPSRTLPPQRGADAPEKDVLFDYFAAEVFDKAAPDVRRVLLSTALLPEVTVAAASALSGEARAGDILSDLVRRSYFTLRLNGTEPRYRYHPLFRDFLLNRARRVEASGWRDLARRTAFHLADTGLADDAAAILLGERAFSDLAELAVAQAPTLASHGRLATLGTWLGALPEAIVSSEPWLSYWLGACEFLSPLEARIHLSRAYDEFEARGDRAGALLAWSGAVGTFVFIWDEFTGLDAWIARLEGLRLRGLTYPSVEVEARVALGALASLMWRAPMHSSLGYWLGRVEALSESEAPAELRMQLAAYLSIYWVTWRGMITAGERVIERARALLEAPDVTPLTQTLWYACDAQIRARRAEPDACLAAVDRGLHIVQESGVHGVSQLLAAEGTCGGLVAGDPAVARRYHEIALTFQSPHEKLNAAHRTQLAAWIHLAAGDLARAERDARGALALATESGAASVVPEAWFTSTLAFVLLKRGRRQEAIALFERCLRLTKEANESAVRYHCELSLVWAHLAEGRPEEARELLRSALVLGRDQEYVAPFWIGWDKPMMADIAAFALEHGLEDQFVTDTIGASRLTPPAGAPESWPWPVRVRLLGGFELWRDGERVSFPRKVQRKPLELLRAVALLGGTDVRESSVVDALWPDSDGDRAAHSLETAAYRLRQLLRCPAALRQQDERLSLDPRFCWIDAVSLLQRLERALATVAHDSTAQVEMEANRLLTIYRGPLTAFDENQQHAKDLGAALRQKLESGLTRFLREAELRLAKESPTAARALADRARAVDPALGR